ncbi:MAG: EamA family transporter [Psychroflexus sp.]|nr:EamA family transporter [Psychroflexus sp.]MDN6309183.1 EamA family transporter [Psychroflexus sp.]
MRQKFSVPNQYFKWISLISLALLWGSSFILIKKSLIGLTPVQLGAVRVLITGIVLGAVGFKKVKHLNRKQWFWVALSGFIGTFFPSILFAYAETEIDSAIASILNSTVPLLALIVGLVFFGTAFIRQQFVGVFIGLIGSVLLIFAGASLNPDQNYWYAIFPLIATLMYAFNANIIKAYLQQVPALGIATGSFLALIPVSLVVLFSTDFFTVSNLSSPETHTALFYVTILAVLGTALAKIIFNRLIQVSDPVSSASVTYLIPIVALFWGFVDGEQFNVMQFGAGLIILLGVYLANKKKGFKK